MAFDGITTYHLTLELQETLVGGKIRKIYQPDHDEIRLFINRHGENHLLLLSANANNPRVYLTQKKKDNPAAPPSFCMALRKHLIGGTVSKIYQHLSDRVILFDILVKNEFNEPVTKTLIAEIMGRNSNIILTQSPENIPESENDGGDASPVIIDTLKKIGASSSRYRQILPGYRYIFPPERDRLNLFIHHEASDLSTVLSRRPKGKLADALIKGYLGVSPQIAREICFRAGLDPDSCPADLSVKRRGFLEDAFADVLGDILASCRPELYYFRRTVRDFSTIPLRQYDSLTRKAAPSVSAMLEAFYYEKDKKARFQTRSADLKHRLTTLYKKETKKLSNLHNDLLHAENAEIYKIYGDLITANVYALEKGMTEATLPNYHDPDYAPLRVPLKVNETPMQNAQRYYQKYNKSKRALDRLAEQIALTEDNVFYLSGVLDSLNRCTELPELEEIRHEAAVSGLFDKRGRGVKTRRPEASKPMRFRSSEGFEILVGKNNYQNDAIATRLGDDEDCWLHVKNAPGSHVLIKAEGRFITEATLLEAGALAAWFSSVRGSEHVEVDYVEYKFVKKPKKAKPGMVIFTGQNTMNVRPDKRLAETLAIEEA